MEKMFPGPLMRKKEEVPVDKKENMPLVPDMDMENKQEKEAPLEEKHENWMKDKLKKFAEDHSTMVMSVEYVAAWVSAVAAEAGIIIASSKIFPGNHEATIVTGAVGAIAIIAPSLIAVMNKIMDKKIELDERKNDIEIRKELGI